MRLSSAFIWWLVNRCTPIVQPAYLMRSLSQSYIIYISITLEHPSLQDISRDDLAEVVEVPEERRVKFPLVVEISALRCLRDISMKTCWEAWDLRCKSRQLTVPTGSVFYMTALITAGVGVVCCYVFTVALNFLWALMNLMTQECGQEFWQKDGETACNSRLLNAVALLNYGVSMRNLRPCCKNTMKNNVRSFGWIST